MDIESELFQIINEKYRSDQRDIQQGQLFTTDNSEFADTVQALYVGLITSSSDQANSTLPKLFSKFFFFHSRVQREFFEETLEDLCIFLSDLLLSDRLQDKQVALIALKTMSIHIIKVKISQKILNFQKCLSIVKEMVMQEIQLSITNELEQCFQEILQFIEEQDIKKICEKQYLSLQENILKTEESILNPKLLLINIFRNNQIINTHLQIEDPYYVKDSRAIHSINILKIIIDKFQIFLENEVLVDTLLKAIQTKGHKLNALSILSKGVDLFSKSDRLNEIIRNLSYCLIDSNLSVRSEATIILKGLTPLKESKEKDELSNVLFKKLLKILFSLMFFNQNIKDDNLKQESKICSQQIFDGNQQKEFIIKNLQQVISVSIIQSSESNQLIQKSCLHTIGRALMSIPKDNPSHSALKIVYQDLVNLIVEVPKSEENIILSLRLLQFIAHIAVEYQDQKYCQGVLSLGFNSIKINNELERNRSVSQFINLVQQIFDMIVSEMHQIVEQKNQKESNELIKLVSVIFTELYRKKETPEHLNQVLGIIQKILLEKQLKLNEEQSNMEQETIFNPEKWLNSLNLKDLRDKDIIKKYFDSLGIFELLIKETKRAQNFIKFLEENFGKPFIVQKLNNLK